MGLLSNLLGGNQDAEKVEKAAKELMNGLGGILGGLGEQIRQGQTGAVSPQTQTYRTDAAPRSGFSWGDEMPAEENQYNYGGPYWAYFEGIFDEELSGLRCEKEALRPGKRITYTFWGGPNKKLVVELMSETCSAKALREQCRREGVPYLRFYFDHDGWWNTREYVTTRIRSAVG